jgi:plasmid stabilization system protein ParE
MKVVILDEAADDLDGIFTWIAKDNPRAAATVARRIRAKIGTLSTPALTEMGRPGRRTGTRELIEGPYIIVYSIHDDRGEIRVSAVFHGAQNK